MPSRDSSACRRPRSPPRLKRPPAGPAAAPIGTDAATGPPAPIVPDIALIGATVPWCQHRRGDGRPRSDPLPSGSRLRTRLLVTRSRRRRAFEARSSRPAQPARSSVRFRKLVDGSDRGHSGHKPWTSARVAITQRTPPDTQPTFSRFGGARKSAELPARKGRPRRVTRRTASTCYAEPHGRPR